MRRTISVAIAGLLGAGLMASSVIAQQLSTLSGKPSGQSVSTDKAGGDNSSRTPIDDQVYGLSTTRGTRYLLRNGLDYLNYKEYDRALKFLRETEGRKDELNRAERLLLQKGIESAQRGLREAANVKSRYALSERSHEQIGFSLARPVKEGLRQPGNSQILTSKSVVYQARNARSTSNTESDEHGEPIRLASSDTAQSTSNPVNPNSTSAGKSNNNSPLPRPDANPPMPFPEIHEISNLLPLRVPPVIRRLSCRGIAPNFLRIHRETEMPSPKQLRTWVSIRLHMSWVSASHPRRRHSLQECSLKQPQISLRVRRPLTHLC